MSAAWNEAAQALRVVERIWDAWEAATWDAAADVEVKAGRVVLKGLLHAAWQDLCLIPAPDEEGLRWKRLWVSTRHRAVSPEVLAVIEADTARFAEGIAA